LASEIQKGLKKKSRLRLRPRANKTYAT
jgi:hypothetical protein